MKVKELIKELKKQPQDCIVGKSDHDNSHNEVSGLIQEVYFLKKEEIDMNYPDCDCVVLHC